MVRRLLLQVHSYSSYKQKSLAVFICRVENVLVFDAAVYSTERDQIMFAKQYLIGNAAAAWNQYCMHHPTGIHTWAAMKDLPLSWVVLTKHHNDAAFQKLHSAKQDPNQSVTFIGTYGVTICKGTDTTDYNRCMFFWTGLHLEIHATIRKGKDYLSFDT